MGKFEQVVSVCVVVVVSPKPGLSLWLFKYSTGATELCVTHVKEGRGKQSWSQAFNTTACNMSKIKWESSMSVLIHICIHTQQDGGGKKKKIALFEWHAICFIRLPRRKQYHTVLDVTGVYGTWTAGLRLHIWRKKVSSYPLPKLETKAYNTTPSDFMKTKWP